jgi:rubrerythrin
MRAVCVDKGALAMDEEASLEQFLDKAAELERTVAGFYDEIAKEIPGHAQFFERMAREELEHAEALISFSDFVQVEQAIANPLRPMIFEIEEGIRFVTQKCEQVAGNQGLEWAISAARLIEASQLERNYTRHMVGQTDAVRTLLAQMAADERDHIDRLRELAKAGEVRWK